MASTKSEWMKTPVSVSLFPLVVHGGPTPPAETLHAVPKIFSSPLAPNLLFFLQWPTLIAIVKPHKTINVHSTVTSGVPFFSHGQKRQKRHALVLHLLFLRDVRFFTNICFYIVLLVLCKNAFVCVWDFFISRSGPVFLHKSQLLSLFSLLLINKFF